MTGYNSKRNMAQAKLDEDDDTQVYADTLLIVYQRGFADGKRSAQRKPLTNGEIYTAYITATNQTLRPQDERLALAFARAIEAAHNIKEQP
tara:strand:+ start:133 stop:405 length:273 start_codon:yes stop_codon:yes gene_type:complete